MLPDTLGILNPSETFDFCSSMIRKFSRSAVSIFMPITITILAVANVDAAIRAGITTVHTTVNGLGERAGNAPLSSVIALLNDQLKLPNSVNERKLSLASRIVENFSGIRISGNKPIIGEKRPLLNAAEFTLTAIVKISSITMIYFRNVLAE